MMYVNLYSPQWLPPINETQTQQKRRCCGIDSHILYALYSVGCELVLVKRIKLTVVHFMAQCKGAECGIKGLIYR